MKDFTTGKEGKLIVGFALPMLLGSVFQQLYGIVDSIIVGNYLDSVALSAVGASFPIFYALIALIIGLASGAATVIGQIFGAKNNEKVKVAVDTMFVLLIVSAVIISVVGVIFAESIMRIIDLPEEVIPDATIYLQIFLGGLIFDFGYNGTASVLRSLGDSKTPMYFIIIATVTNIILDLVFIIVLDMGVEGAAIATIISKAGAFITAVWYINNKHELLKLNFLKLKFDKKIFMRSVKIGLPTGLQQIFVAVGMAGVLKIVNGFGTTVIAAYTVVHRIDFIAVMPPMIFSQALAAFTAQNFGAGKIDRVKKGFKSVLVSSSVVSIIVSTLIYIFGTYLMRMFTPEEDVIQVGVEYLSILAFSYILFAIMFSFIGVFRGVGDTLIPMFITLISLWLIRIPFADYLSGVYDEKGIWYSVPLAWAFGALASLTYYLIGRWKKIKVKRDEDGNVI